jgi:hypothetical protein
MCHFIRLSTSRVIKACTDKNVSSSITECIGGPTGPLWIYRRVRLDLGIPRDYSYNYSFAVFSPITTNQGTAILLASFGFCVNQGTNQPLTREFFKLKQGPESPLASVYSGRPVPADLPDSAVYERLCY